MPKKIALNINFDSLSDCLKLVGAPALPKGAKDPCFFDVMTRFLKLASEYEAKFTLFMVGQDLENPAHAEAVANWSELGHEIANHSYSHRHDLSRLSIDEIRSEILKTDELLLKITKKPVRGFTSPGWHSSQKITDTLKSLGYQYDASLGPTWLFQLAQSVLWLKSPGARGMVTFLRHDIRANLFGVRHPYIPSDKNYLNPDPETSGNRHIIIPLPTTRGFRLGLWHTLALSLPNAVFKTILSSSLRNTDYFYYLMHPLDLLDPKKDLEGMDSRLSRIHRINLSYQEKEVKLRRSLERLAQEGEFVTMSELASAWSQSP